MFDSVNEPSFRLEIAGQPQPFAVVAFTGSESISQPFAFELDLQLDELRLDIASLMFRSAYLGFGGGAPVSMGRFMTSLNFTIASCLRSGVCALGRGWLAWRNASTSGYLPGCPSRRFWFRC